MVRCQSSALGAIDIQGLEEVACLADIRLIELFNRWRIAGYFGRFTHLRLKLARRRASYIRGLRVARPACSNSLCQQVHVGRGVLPCSLSSPCTHHIQFAPYAMTRLVHV